MEGHLNYIVIPGEMKMWSLNRGGRSGRFDCIEKNILHENLIFQYPNSESNSNNL